MVALQFFIILIVLSLIQAQSTIEAEFEDIRSTTTKTNELNFQLEHSVDGISFSPRNKFSIQNENKILNLEPSKNGINEEFISGFKTLISNQGLYQLRIRSMFGNESSQFISASIPVCDLQKSGFKEDLVLNLDASRQHIIGLSYSSPVIALSRPCDPSKLKSSQQFQTRVKIVESFQAQTVPLQALGPRPPNMMNLNFEDEGGAGEGGEGENKPKPIQQSFLAKYWYIVVPMMVVMFLPTADEKDKKKGKGQKTTLGEGGGGGGGTSE